MTTYAIGDVQGCFKSLMKLLKLINFDRENDTLWFTGDLVNRGPQSLEVLRFVSELPRVVCVLGNHDLALLVLAYTQQVIKHHTLNDILSAPDKEKLLNWLRRQPLFYVDSHFDAVLVHAGIPPQWNIEKTLHHASEVSDYLSSDDYQLLLQNLFGNEPNRFSESLCQLDRFRFTINALTRMRFCREDGSYDLNYKGTLSAAPAYLIPWYQFPRRKQEEKTVLFGHWAALKGAISNQHLEALDTGCYWGGQLTALCLETRKRFQIICGENCHK